MNKILLGLLVLSAVLVAQPSEMQNIEDALCQLVSTTQSIFGFAIMASIILAVPLMLIGAYLYFKKKENKTLKITGIVLAVIGIAGPILLIIFYLLIPVLVSMMTGADINSITTC